MPKKNKNSNETFWLIFKHCKTSKISQKILDFWPNCLRNLIIKSSEKVRKLRSDASHVNLCFPQNYLRILSDLFLKTLVNFMTLELLIIVLSIHRVTSVMEVLSSPTDHFSWTNRKLRFDQENDVKIIATNGEEEVHHLFSFVGWLRPLSGFLNSSRNANETKKFKDFI